MAINKSSRLSHSRISYIILKKVISLEVRYCPSRPEENESSAATEDVDPTTDIHTDIRHYHVVLTAGIDSVTLTC